MSEDERIAALQAGSLGEHLEGLPRQRNVVGTAHLHATARNLPDALAPVDLRPSRLSLTDTHVRPGGAIGRYSS